MNAEKLIAQAAKPNPAPPAKSPSDRAEAMAAMITRGCQHPKFSLDLPAKLARAGYNRT